MHEVMYDVAAGGALIAKDIRVLCGVFRASAAEGVIRDAVVVIRVAHVAEVAHEGLGVGRLVVVNAPLQVFFLDARFEFFYRLAVVLLDTGHSARICQGVPQRARPLGVIRALRDAVVPVPLVHIVDRALRERRHGGIYLYARLVYKAVLGYLVFDKKLPVRVRLPALDCSRAIEVERADGVDLDLDFRAGVAVARPRVFPRSVHVYRANAAG